MPQRVRYGQANIENELARLSVEDIDRLPFGVIKIDRLGNIIQYNIAESKFAHRRVEDVVGKNFFREIAPCTRHPSFLGQFLEGRDKGMLDIQFEYIFDFRMKPALVSIQIRNSVTDNHYWLLIEWRVREGVEFNYSPNEIDDDVAERLLSRLGEDGSGEDVHLIDEDTKSPRD